MNRLRIVAVFVMLLAGMPPVSSAFAGDQIGKVTTSANSESGELCNSALLSQSDPIILALGGGGGGSSDACSNCPDAKKMWTCDNNYACNPDSPPPGCGTCRCNCVQ